MGNHLYRIMIYFLLCSHICCPRTYLLFCFADFHQKADLGEKRLFLAHIFKGPYCFGSNLFKNSHTWVCKPIKNELRIKKMENPGLTQTRSWPPWDVAKWLNTGCIYKKKLSNISQLNVKNKSNYPQIGVRLDTRSVSQKLFQLKGKYPENRLSFILFNEQNKVNFCYLNAVGYAITIDEKFN